MRQPRAWRATAFLLALLAMLVLLPAVRAQGTKGKTVTIDRPGDAPYTPSKLEWAALELQSYFGRTWAPQDHVDISYMSAGDGTTIRCLLQYTPDVAAQDMKMDRDIAQVNFDKYASRRGWPWLRLKFEEQTLPALH
jgi:hypothetical protein